MVVPRSLKVLHGDKRLGDICQELKRLDREKFPNASIVLLRVFLELAIRDYLKRSGGLPRLKQQLQAKGKLPVGGEPGMKHLAKWMTRVAQQQLPRAEADQVGRALSYQKSSPWTVDEVNGFIHSLDEPTGRDVAQFMKRIEPLLRLMLEQPPKDEHP